MKTSQIPVCVGIPVYNGERYLAAALESLLMQTYENIKIFICDNCSTDATNSICSAFMRSDRRISYIRNSHNIGGTPNYNKCFSFCDTKYFFWLAHDDVLDPYLLEKSVDLLERSPRLGLCHSAVRMIDGSGVPIGINDNELKGAAAEEPWRRLRAVLREDPYCQSVFSLYRSDLLRKTTLLGSHHHADRVLLAEMALLAPFGYIAEPLFMNRLHDERYTKRVKAASWSTWHDPRAAGKRQFPMWRAYGRYIDAIRTLVPDRRQRMLCRRELVLWWFVGFNAGHMLIDALSAYEPGVFDMAQAVKHRLVGSRADWLVAHGRDPRP